jgi:hypothetical protein
MPEDWENPVNAETSKLATANVTIEFVFINRCNFYPAYLRPKFRVMVEYYI